MPYGGGLPKKENSIERIQQARGVAEKSNDINRLSLCHTSSLEFLVLNRIEVVWGFLFICFICFVWLKLVSVGLQTKVSFSQNPPNTYRQGSLSPAQRGLAWPPLMYFLHFCTSCISFACLSRPSRK